MSFKTIAGGFNGAFWWYGPLSEDREKNLTNLPKLSCGFISARKNKSVFWCVFFINEACSKQMKQKCRAFYDFKYTLRLHFDNALIHLYKVRDGTG